MAEPDLPPEHPYPRPVPAGETASPVFSDRRSARSDTHYRILRLIEQNPEMSQRELARALGVSLGGVHYCLKALIAKGLVKARGFAAAPRKAAYSYVLTPAGIAEKSALTRSFLSRKRAEYEAIRAEISALEAELGLPPRERAERSDTPARRSRR